MLTYPGCLCLVDAIDIVLQCLGVNNVRSASVFGFGGPSLMIGIADILMWEFVWQRHTNQKDMVELGTMSGGTSLYWGMAARVRGGQFHTFDLYVCTHIHAMPYSLGYHLSSAHASFVLLLY